MGKLMMPHNQNEEDLFQDEACNQCIEKITYLESLIEIEASKLFEAMRNTKPFDFIKRS